jgi:hypothetical protein
MYVIVQDTKIETEDIPNIHPIILQAIFYLIASLAPPPKNQIEDIL